ncbi:hypothetical protein JSE7799_03269 [Jannaschia seosinensis]|uniref:STAS domain-containing protein n=1 Tax=Jannaschia seosinensis TaxID=313367 RepID=A0A0M7BGL6_9RHOB|nr:hypothetical protein [Jannaschia seosinensis]CUH40535.1 hypothetical protein JSE7799_03269 [Jannaschia seosinensis]
MIDGCESVSGARIPLPKRFDMIAAETLRADVTGRTGDIILTADAVSVLTTPALQLLMALRDRQAARGDALYIGTPSDAFLACIRTLGVSLDRLHT